MFGLSVRRTARGNRDGFEVVFAELATHRKFHMFVRLKQPPEPEASAFAGVARVLPTDAEVIPTGALCWTARHSKVSAAALRPASSSPVRYKLLSSSQSRRSKPLKPDVRFVSATVPMTYAFTGGGLSVVQRS